MRHPGSSYEQRTRTFSAQEIEWEVEEASWKCDELVVKLSGL